MWKTFSWRRWGLRTALFAIAYQLRMSRSFRITSTIGLSTEKPYFFNRRLALLSISSSRLAETLIGLGSLVVLAWHVFAEDDAPTNRFVEQTKRLLDPDEDVWYGDDL